jgi:uncharacterized protein (DUF2384 family)
MKELAKLTNTELTVSIRSELALSEAKELVINDDQSRLAAGTFLKVLKALQVEVKADREAEYKAAKATVDAITTSRNKHLSPLMAAEKIIKAKQIADEDAQAAKRKAEQEEQERLAQEEAERLAEEAAMLAAELEEIGDAEQAAEVLAAPIEAPAPVVIPNTAPKIDGQHTVVNWKCRLVDFAATPIGLHQFDQVAANKWVAGIKAELSKTVIDSGRQTQNNEIIKRIAELPNGTVLTKEILGVDVIPGCEIYIEKSRAASWK